MRHCIICGVEIQPNDEVYELSHGFWKEDEDHCTGFEETKSSFTKGYGHVKCYNEKVKK